MKKLHQVLISKVILIVFRSQKNRRNLSLFIILHFLIKGVTINSETQPDDEKVEEEKDNKKDEDVVDQENDDNTVNEK